MKENVEIMIVAGEASGDRLGAELVRELRARCDGISFFGTPGPEMRRCGVESVFDSDKWSIVGIAAVAKAIPSFLKLRSALIREANERKPAAVILIDFPEFNLKLARPLKRNGHRVVYYVSPQVWAWRKYRSKTIRDSVDLLLSILPFEREWYANRGVVHIEYVGSPVVARAKPTISRDDLRDRYKLDRGAKLIALLPGSRRKEIRRHLSTMLDAAKLITKEIPSAQFAIGAANEDASKEIQSLLDQNSGIAPALIAGHTIDLLNAADAAAVSSGTATLEAGVVGTPMAVVYKVPKLDYYLLRPFVKVPYFALINLIAGRKVAKELMQNEFTARNLAIELIRVLDPDENLRIRSELKAIVRTLNANDPSGHAAEAILRFLGYRSRNDLHS